MEEIKRSYCTCTNKNISINLACAFYGNYQGGYRIPHHHNTVQFEGYDGGLRKEDAICTADYHKDL